MFDEVTHFAPKNRSVTANSDHLDEEELLRLCLLKALVNESYRGQQGEWSTENECTLPEDILRETGETGLDFIQQSHQKNLMHRKYTGLMSSDTWSSTRLSQDSYDLMTPSYSGETAMNMMHPQYEQRLPSFMSSREDLSDWLNMEHKNTTSSTQKQDSNHKLPPGLSSSDLHGSFNSASNGSDNLDILRKEPFSIINSVSGKASFDAQRNGSGRFVGDNYTNGAVYRSLNSMDASYSVVHPMNCKSVSFDNGTFAGITNQLPVMPHIPPVNISKTVAIPQNYDYPLQLQRYGHKNVRLNNRYHRLSSTKGATDINVSSTSLHSVPPPPALQSGLRICRNNSTQMKRIPPPPPLNNTCLDGESTSPVNVETAVENDHIPSESKDSFESDSPKRKASDDSHSSSYESGSGAVETSKNDIESVLNIVRHQRYRQKNMTSAKDLSTDDKVVVFLHRSEDDCEGSFQNDSDFNEELQQLSCSVNELRLIEELLRAALLIPNDVDGNLTSLGSTHHFSGQCRPCQFQNNVKRPGGCRKGVACMFCHFSHQCIEKTPRRRAK